jgi:DNA excision repair protein ERCC-4
MPKRLVVVYDTREQRPWRFAWPCLCQKLDAGDYTLQGFEKKLRIERKGSTTEFAGNCSPRDWPRFSEALKRLAQVKHKAIICEFTLADIMREDWRGAVTADVMLGRISEINLEYGIPVLLAGKNSRTAAETFLLRYFNRNGR